MRDLFRMSDEIERKALMQLKRKGKADRAGEARKESEEMELRKLEQTEHHKTRALWELVFSEDTKAFLDYYYYFKTRDNEIYVIEEDGAIRSMLQLNPYMLWIEEDTHLCHYVIAVATEENYRRRGYMGQLLCQAMQEMYDRKEPFTFLMPAAERIYTPYDFRFVYDQRQAEESMLHLQVPAASKQREDTGCETAGESGDVGDNKAGKAAGIGYGKTRESVDAGNANVETFSDAAVGDAEEIAGFVQEHFAGKWQVYAVRDMQYYQTQIFEQQSENGGIRLMRVDGKLVGIFFYSDEDGLEIREPLYLEGYEPLFRKAVCELMCSRGPSVKVYAWEGGEKKEPLIMVRILHLTSLLSCMKVRKGETMDCSFAVLDSILKQNSRIYRIQGGETTEWRVHVCETEDSEGVLSIGALTSLLFGYRTIEEAAQEEDVMLTERLKKELGKLQPLERVWLNEIV